MIKNQNYAVESYEAPNCQVVEVKSQQVLCQSILPAEEHDYGTF